MHSTNRNYAQMLMRMMQTEAQNIVLRTEFAADAALLEDALSIGLKFHEAGNIKFKQKKFGEATKLYTYALR